MNTEDINDILSRGVTAQFYRGTFPSDVDFGHFKKPYCCVTNVDSHNGVGSHWNAWFITNDTIFFFDSFGRRPTDNTFPRSYKRFVESQKYTYNPRIVQGLFSDTCGQFCIYVLYYKCLNTDWKIILRSFDVDLDENDMKMRDFVKQL